MRVSVIQSKQKVLYDVNNPGEFNLETCKKLSKEVLEEGFKLIEEAAQQGAQLIVTMEAINTVIFPHDPRYDFKETVEELDGPIVTRFSELSKKYSTYIIGGLYNKREGKVYNSGILFNPKGEIEGIYDKVHLVGGEKVGLTPGNSFPVFKTDIGSIGILVCWDMQFPEAARELVLGGADLIACPTWGWENIYGLSRAYENDVVIAAAMAVPPHCPIEGIRSPSCIVDGTGTILAQGEKENAGVVSADVVLKPKIVEDGLTMREIRLGDRHPDTYKLGFLSTQNN